ncbi:hypothetical protein DL89DRAFT_256322 [Linderina pennispora]|uniref:Uncharacterized protein n=1 Tax=Linderina pennispora TaxID=61395 RepID=A0A1Y1WCN1_9FUNG|nr:uncharacterized protein DL89DRAFT_256322 [Linderina pennispora]ORX71291.1 hypothetical protein DL89DRAFT_256322 [Linderina pennispora]
MKSKEFKYSVQSLSTARHNSPVIILVTRNDDLVMAVWCLVDGEDRAKAEAHLKQLLIKYNIDCGFLMDADKAVFYSLFYLQPYAEAVELKTYQYHTQALEVVELLYGFTRHNNVRPDAE